MCDDIEVLIPVYNDWASASLLIGSLLSIFREKNINGAVLLVNDGSQEAQPAGFLSDIHGSSVVRILNLTRNLGHQRALAIGLSFLADEGRLRNVVLMDGDGEDDPEDVPRLIDELKSSAGTRIIFAGRMQRSEGLVFSIGYHSYRLMHRLLTGQSIRFGNFSIIPAAMLRRIASISDIWNHYASGVGKAGFPLGFVSTCRGRRLAGESKMNFVGLISHGLSAISVYGEAIGVRLLIASFSAILILLAAAITVVVLRLFTDLAILGWASIIFSIICIAIFQVGAMSLQFSFIVMEGRSSLKLIPLRDYKFFVDTVVSLVESPSSKII